MFTWTYAAPDEIAIGHASRLFMVNWGYAGMRWRYGKDLRNAIRQHLKELGRDLNAFLPTLHYLAAGSGKDSASYISEHSWLAYDRVVRNWWEKACYSDWCSRGRRPDVGLGPPLHHVYYFCRRCVEEDLDVLGFSYWRRIHQFLGIDRCVRHGGGLSAVRIQGMGLGLPQMYLGRELAVDAELMAAIVDDPVIARYECIAAGLLKRNTTTSNDVARRVLWRRREELRLLLGGRKSNIDLRDRILREFPSEWVTEHFISRQTSNYSDPRWTPTSAVDHALALAVLFDSPDEALLCFSDNTNMPAEMTNRQPALANAGVGT